MTSPDKLLPVHIVALRLAVSKHTVYRLINAGYLEAANLGTRQKACWRVYANSLDRYLEKNTERF